ncbi:MAG: hypothetical protein LBG17_00220 [Bacteroidales bacterium]|jgi:hypothetical protein|nr:hypothetical protein [Bacteroidales bacterium]
MKSTPITQEQQFGYHRKYGYIPNMPHDKRKSDIGALFYLGREIERGPFALLQYKKRQHILRGCDPQGFKITYALTNNNL